MVRLPRLPTPSLSLRSNPIRHPSARTISSANDHPYFRLLAIESSADDSCAAIVDSNRRVLSNVIQKQHSIHESFRGIVPSLAYNAHQKNVPVVIKKALQHASLSFEDIDAIAFTQGPGMFNCLGVACSTASGIAAFTGKPIIGVNHMQAHALTPLMTSRDDPPEFPFLTLLISGGHTQLVLATSLDDFQILVDTGGMAVGNVIDRLAALLRLPYSPSHGLGPSLEAVFNSPLPDTDLPTVKPLSIPHASQPKFELVGLLASSLQQLHVFAPDVTNQDPRTTNGHTFLPDALTEPEKVAVVREFFRAITSTLTVRVKKEVERLKKEDGLQIRGLVASGGAASNGYIRSRLQSLGDDLDIKVFFPPIEMCTDNAAMIGNAAVHRYRERRFTPIEEAYPRKTWSIRDVRLSAEEAGDGDRRT